MPNRKSLYRAMEILPLLLVVVLVFSAICLANSKEIVLRYDGQEKVVTTILEDPRSILEESGVKVGKEDRILISPANAEKKTREVIELKRALPVTIEKYGVSKKFYTGKATVGEALDALAINYEGKTVYPAVDTPITSDLEIHILGRFDELHEEEQPIEPPVEFVDNLEKPYGENKVLEPGVPGKMKVTRKTTLKDGLFQTHIISKTVLEEPRRELVERGMELRQEGDVLAAGGSHRIAPLMYSIQELMMATIRAASRRSWHYWRRLLRWARKQRRKPMAMAIRPTRRSCSGRSSRICRNQRCMESGEAA